MRLHSVEIMNVRQHAHSRIEFPERGIVGIVGENESGKSTILEAVAFALFGTKAIRPPKSGLRWKRAPGTRKAAVTLEFEVAGERYVIERDESNASVRRAGAIELLASGTSTVDAYVPELIGMSLEEFSATFLCEQKSIDRIASMKPTERQTFIREVMQIGRIDEALKACRKRRNELATEAAGIEQGLGEREPLVAERDAAKAALVEAHSQVEAATTELKSASQAAADAAEALQHLAAAKQKVDEVSTTLRLAEADAVRISAEREQVVTELDAATAAAARVEAADAQLAALPALRVQKEELASASATARERASLQQLVAAAAADIQKYGDELASIDAAIGAYEPDAHQRVRDAFDSAKARLRTLQQSREHAKAKAEADAANAEKQVALTQRRIAEIERQGHDGACPTCQRALGEQLGYVLNLLRETQREYQVVLGLAEEKAAELSDPSDDELELTASLEPLDADLRRHEQDRRVAQDAERHRPAVLAALGAAKAAHAQRCRDLAQIPDVTFDAAALQDVTQRIATLERLQQDILPDRVIAGRVGMLTGKLALLEHDLANARNRAASAREALATIGFDADAYEHAEKVADRMRDDRAAAETQLARSQGAASAAGARLARAEAALSEYDGRAQRLTELRAEIRTHEQAARRLDEFRDDQVQLLRPELEALVSGFVSLLTDGRHESVTVTEEFDVILQEGGIDMEIVSGGTQDIAAIALRLAISQMIAERAGHPLSLLVLDEPFGSLSEVRRGNVMNLLRQLGDLFGQILLISHVEETREAADHIIEVRFDEAAGCSTVTQTLTANSEQRELAEVAA